MPNKIFIDGVNIDPVSEYNSLEEGRLDNGNVCKGYTASLVLSGGESCTDESYRILVGDTLGVTWTVDSNSNESDKIEILKGQNSVYAYPLNGSLSGSVSIDTDGWDQGVYAVNYVSVDCGCGKTNNYKDSEVLVVDGATSLGSQEGDSHAGE